MAVSNQQQNFTRTNHSFIPLNQLPQQGAGESGRYLDNVTGVMLGIEARPGVFEFTDRRTGQKVQKPNSYTAVFEDGSMFSWPWIRDEQGNWKLWDRYDTSINLVQCVQNRIAIHVWRDERGFCHLELVQQQAQQMPVVNQVYAPGTQPQQNGMPWDMQ